VFVDAATNTEYLLNINPTSITISQTVPEPSTYAGFAGLAALGAAAFIRRKRRQ
jgi:hypothetical protein